MIEKGNKKWWKLTFSQREGKVPLPEALQPDQLTDRFRNRLWMLVDRSILDGCERNMYGNLNFHPYKAEGEFWKIFFISIQLDVFDKPHDGFHNGPNSLREFIRKIIIEGEYHTVITVVEYLLRHQYIYKTLSDQIESILLNETAYGIDKSTNPICIFPTTSEEMRRSTQQALDNISKSKLEGAKRLIFTMLYKS